ncbi:aconitase X swivel domain-containing protein [Pseudescherichia vulneris]
MKLLARSMNPGDVVAEAFLVEQAFSFIGDFDPQTGALLIPHHPRYGESLAGKALVCPGGKGGTMAPCVSGWQGGNHGAVFNLRGVSTG